MDRKTLQDHIDREELTGKDVRHLMRIHKVTIRGLAQRFGCTQKRVHEVRRHGLRNIPGRVWVKDWIECITQTGMYSPERVEKARRIQELIEQDRAFHARLAKTIPIQQ